MFGVFEHDVVKRTSPLTRGFDDTFKAPHSRYTEVHAEDIEAHPDLEIIATSKEAGVYIAKSTDSSNFFVFGHPEYDCETLKAEYDRDIARGLDVALPAHYYPKTTPRASPFRPGARTRSCSTPTGSTTTSTRPRPTTSTPSATGAKRVAPDRAFRNLMGKRRLDAIS